MLTRDLRDADAGLIPLQGNGEFLFLAEEAPQRLPRRRLARRTVKALSGGILLALLPATGRAEG